MTLLLFPLSSVFHSPKTFLGYTFAVLLTDCFTDYFHDKKFIKYFNRTHFLSLVIRTAALILYLLGHFPVLVYFLKILERHPKNEVSILPSAWALPLLPHHSPDWKDHQDGHWLLCIFLLRVLGRGNKTHFIQQLSRRMRLIFFILSKVWLILTFFLQKNQFI